MLLHLVGVPFASEYEEKVRLLHASPNVHMNMSRFTLLENLKGQCLGGPKELISPEKSIMQCTLPQSPSQSQSQRHSPQVTIHLLRPACYSQILQGVVLLIHRRRTFLRVSVRLSISISLPISQCKLRLHLPIRTILSASPYPSLIHFLTHACHVGHPTNPISPGKNLKTSNHQPFIRQTFPLGWINSLTP